MSRLIYIVWDIVAHDTVTGLLVYNHHAAAIRAFVDGLKDQRGPLAKHPADFELRLVGELTTDGTINALDQYEVVLSGSTWLASTQPQEANTDGR